MYKVVNSCRTDDRFNIRRLTVEVEEGRYVDVVVEGREALVLMSPSGRCVYDENSVYYGNELVNMETLRECAIAFAEGRRPDYGMDEYYLGMAEKQKPYVSGWRRGARRAYKDVQRPAASYAGYGTYAR